MFDLDDITCPTCGGEGSLLGQLGNRLHLRCRCCGMDFSQEAEAEPQRPQHADYCRGERDCSCFIRTMKLNGKL